MPKQCIKRPKSHFAPTTNGFPLKNQGNKCRNNKGNSNPLFKLANDREQVTRVLSSPSEQLLGKGLKQQAGLNKRHKKTINGD